MGTAFATGHNCAAAAAAHYVQAGTASVDTIHTALREQNALIDGDDLPDPAPLLELQIALLAFQVSAE